MPPKGLKIFYVESLITTTKKIRLAKQKIKRKFLMFLLGQTFLVRHKLPLHAKKILIIYFGTPQLGDSIMDLSIKQYFKRLGLVVDLLAGPAVVGIHQQDGCFRRITDSISKLDNRYDHIVLFSINPKNIWYKFLYSPFKEFSTFQGVYYGQEFGRKEFSYHAFCQQLNINPQKSIPTFIRSFEPAIAQDDVVSIAIGGLIDARTYDKWSEVIETILRRHPTLTINLLGSANALEDSRKIQSKLISAKNIRSYIAKTTLDQVFNFLLNSRVVICSDSGLLHLAQSCRRPLLALFSGNIHPYIRIDQYYPAISIFSGTSSVKQIKAELIADSFELMYPTPQTSHVIFGENLPKLRVSG